MGAGAAGWVWTPGRGPGRAVKASPDWREKDRLLRGIPGLGPVSSPMLLAASCAKRACTSLRLALVTCTVRILRAGRSGGGSWTG